MPVFSAQGIFTLHEVRRGAEPYAQHPPKCRYITRSLSRRSVYLLRRLTAVLMSLLLFQVTLAGSGASCGEHGTDSASASIAMPAGSPHGSMAGMAAGMTMSASGQTVVGTAGGDMGMPPCHLPCAPGGPGGCVSMATCAGPALTSTQGNTASSGAASAPLVRFALATPPSRGAAPDTPPPRA